jgi:hypothetical protein
MGAVLEEEPMVDDTQFEQDDFDPIALVEQRLRELLEAGEPLSAITAERIFEGISLDAPPAATQQPGAAELAAFLRALRSRAARTERQLFVSANQAGIFFPEPSRPVSEQLGEAIAEVTAEVGAAYGMTVLLEERPVRGRMPEIETPAGCLRFVLGRPALYEQEITLENGRWPYEREGRRPQVHPLRLDGHVVGAREGEGRGSYQRLFVHPFLHRGGLSLFHRDASVQMLHCLVVAATQRPTRSRNEERLQAARTALEMVAPIAQVMERALPDQLAALAAREQTIESELQQTQARLIDLLAQRRNLEGERQAAITEQEALSRETVIRALRESARIAQLPPVRSVNVVARGARPELRVQLHPVVLEERGERYLCRKLIFSLPLSDPSPSGIRWERSDEVGSPHPHVAPGDHHTCWGEASAHLAAALGRGELAAAVVVIAGWARLYNHSSPYYEISNFPTTTLAPGFHPEVDA